MDQNWVNIVKWHDETVDMHDGMMKLVDMPGRYILGSISRL